MACNLGVLEGDPPVRQIRRDPRRPERVKTAGRGRESRCRPPLDHRQHDASRQRPPGRPLPRPGPGRPGGELGRRSRNLLHRIRPGLDDRLRELEARPSPVCDERRHQRLAHSEGPRAALSPARVRSRVSSCAALCAAAAAASSSLRPGRSSGTTPTGGHQPPTHGAAFLSRTASRRRASGPATGSRRSSKTRAGRREDQVIRCGGLTGLRGER